MPTFCNFIFPFMVTPKKSLGQHFLKDDSIAQDIVECLTLHHHYRKVLEIGAGTGVLTKFLLNRTDIDFQLVEIDTESVNYLKNVLKVAPQKIIAGDFLALDLAKQFGESPLGIIGNFPYNISSQIFFQVLAHRQQVQEVVCMLQKEVAERIAAEHSNKTYGILSVLLQAFYTIEYKFTVHEHVFNPPPKVKSAVIRLARNEVQNLPCDEKLFTQIVKAGFNQRRKTLRNALKVLGVPTHLQEHPFLEKRAEQLSVQDFINFTANWQQA